jgi:hypothetical protein
MTPEEFKTRLHISDVVRHKGSGRVGKVTRFACDGSTDVIVDGTGPYPQEDFERLKPDKIEMPLRDEGVCFCASFSTCTHK